MIDTTDAKQLSPTAADGLASSFAVGSPYPVDQDSRILDRLNAIYKHRYIAGTTFLLVMIGVFVKTYTTVPMYRAQVRAVIEDERTAEVAGFNTTNSPLYWQPAEAYYQTQYQVLTSHELARKVVKRLHLESVPEFNSAGPQPTRLGAFLSAKQRQAITPFRALLGKSDTERSTPQTVTEDAWMYAFLSRVSVEPVRNSRLVDVSFVSADPTFAALAANVLVEEYVQQNLELRLQATETSLAWLSHEVTKQQQKVEASERAMAAYREAQNALSLENRQNIVVDRLNKLNEAVTRAKTASVQKEALYRQMTSLGTTAEADTILAIIQNPHIQSLKTRLSELQREKARLSERYGDNHPEILKISADIQNASKQLEAELGKGIEAFRNEYQSALTEERTLTTALEEQKRAAMDLDRKSVTYTVLEREAQSNRRIHETLLQREKELQIVRNSRSNNVRIMDRAGVPSVPFAPNPRLNLFLGALTGVALAIGLVVGIDHLDDTIKTPEDIKRNLKIPLLGLVPAVQGNDRPLLPTNAPHEFGEAFRSLRTSLLFSTGGESTRVVLVTSAQPLEGKTTTVCNLAISLAHSGARVLLIDADMWQPSVHRVLGLDNGRGLSDLLTGQAQIVGVVQRLADPSLWIMTSGRTPPNPSELLASARMGALMTNAQSGPFDWVIIDTPPVLALTDAVILTPWVSGVALVIGSEMTQRKLAQRAIETLTTNESRILGAVLNRVDLARNKYYYSGYYGQKGERDSVGAPAA